MRGTALLLLLITFLVFFNSLNGPFQFDDRLFLNDSNLHGPDGWKRMHHGGWTRWISWLTFYWNYRLAGRNAFWYHLVNLLLHLTNVGLVYGLARRASEHQLFPRAAPAAALAAAVFALHPLQTEAVNYIYQRTALLAALFGFLALHFFFRFLKGDRWALAVSVISLALAVLSKESAVGFVAVLAMAWAFTRRDTRFHPYAIAAAAAAFLAVVAWALQSHIYLWTQTLVFWRYVKLCIVPVGLNIDHDVRWAGGLTLAVALALAGIAGLVVFLIWLRRRQPAVVFWCFAFLLLLLPTSSVVAVADPMFEHRLYLPMLGLAGASGCLFHWAFSRQRAASLALCALALVLAAGATWQRNRDWSSEASLWQSAARRSPNKYRPHYNLGTVLLTTEPARAAEHLRRALQLEPGSFDAWHNLGEALARSEQTAGAIEAWRQGLRLFPDSIKLHLALGALHSRRREYQLARQHLLEAVRLDERSAAGFYQLALLFFRFGMLDEAARYAERSLELDARNPEAFDLMAAILRQQGDLGGAEKHRLEAERRR